jgi:hypothetical protein
LGGVKLSPPAASANIWHIIQAMMMDDDECGVIGGIIGQEKPKNS